MKTNSHGWGNFSHEIPSAVGVPDLSRRSLGEGGRAHVASFALLLWGWVQFPNLGKMGPKVSNGWNFFFQGLENQIHEFPD